MSLSQEEKLKLVIKVREGRATAAELVKHGFTQAEVSVAFQDDPEMVEEFKLMQRSRAHQLGLEDLRKVKEEFLAAAGDYYQHRTAKRAFKKGLKKGTLAKVRKDLLKREKQLEKKTQPRTRADTEKLEELKALKARLEEHEKHRKQDKERYDRAKALLLKVVKERIEYVEGQLDALVKQLRKPLEQLEKVREAQQKEIRRANEYFCEHWRKDGAWTDRPVQQRNAWIGPPLPAAKLGAVPHPDRQSPAQESEFEKLKPLPRLQVLNRQRELLLHPHDTFETELVTLRSMQDLVSNSECMWEFVGDIQKWVPRLRMLAESVTEYRRSNDMLAGAAPSLHSQKIRSTGSRSFSIELGVGYGIEKSIVTLDIGLSVMVSGSISLDDDRRMRVNLSLQLVPSLTAAIDTPIGALNAAAQAGFTIASQTYTFVDEQHFAYYLAFRIANLLLFRDRFTEYGNADLHQHIGLYTDDLKAILKKMLGEGELKTMEMYLTTKRVIKAQPLQKWKPDVGFSADASFGVGEEEVGVAVSVEAGLPRNTAFESTELVIPRDGSSPYFLTRTRLGKSHSLSVGMEAQLTSWVKTGLTMTLSKIENDANPDNDGKYLTLVLKTSPYGLVQGLLPENQPTGGDPPQFQLIGDGGGSASASVEDPDGSLLQQVKALAASVLEHTASALQAVHEEVTKNWSVDVLGVVEIEHTTERYLVIACQVESLMPIKSVTVMYTRWIYETGTTISAEGAAETPYGDVALRGSLSWSKSVALQEWFGPSTLAYLQPAFNGYRQRPDGRTRWLELLNTDPRGLRAIFRNIGKTDNPPQVRLDALKYQNWIEEHPEVWQKTPYWDGVVAGAGQVPFVKLCEDLRDQLKLELEPGKTGKRRRLFRKLPGGSKAALEQLKPAFTTFMWRSQLVGQYLEAQKNPWRIRRAYLQAPRGTLRFAVRWNAAASVYEVVRPPILELADNQVRVPEDIYLNAQLSDAASLRTFYEQGFAVRLKVVQSKSRSLTDLRDEEMLFALRLRQPAGSDTLETAYRDLVAKAVGAEDPRLDRLRALVRLHPKLEAHTSDWIAKQASKKADAKEAREAEKAAKKSGATPPPQPAQQTGESYEDTKQRKEIDEAIRLFAQWRDNPDSPIGPASGQGDAIEKVLERITGPFVGYRRG
jgi:hypothetical protein